MSNIPSKNVTKETADDSAYRTCDTQNITFATDPNVTLTANKTGVAHDVVADRRRPVNSFTEVVTSLFKNTGTKDVVASGQLITSSGGNVVTSTSTAKKFAPVMPTLFESRPLLDATIDERISNYFDDFTSGIRKENRSTGIGIKGNIPETCSSVMIESEDPLVDEWYDIQRCKRYIQQINNHGNGGTLASTSGCQEGNEQAKDRLWAELVTKKEQLDYPFLLTAAHITVCSELLNLFSDENKAIYTQIMQALDQKQLEAEEKEKETLLNDYGFDENHVATNGSDTKVLEYKYKKCQKDGKSS